MRMLQEASIPASWKSLKMIKNKLALPFKESFIKLFCQARCLLLGIAKSEIGSEKSKILVSTESTALLDSSRQQNCELFDLSRQTYENIDDRGAVSKVMRLESLANTCIAEQNYELAEQYFAAALEKTLDIFGIDSIECAHGMDAMAKVLYLQKQYFRAEVFIRESIRIYDRHFGPHHLNVAHGWLNIAAIYQAQNLVHYSEHAFKMALKSCPDIVINDAREEISIMSFSPLDLQTDHTHER